MINDCRFWKFAVAVSVYKRHPERTCPDRSIGSRRMEGN